MLPLALLRNTGLIQTFPGHVLAALIAGLCCLFFLQLAKAFKGDWNNSSPIRFLALSPFAEFSAGLRFSEPGHGVTSDSAAPGKSLLDWLCWANRSALFHAGPAIPVRCRSVLCPGVWESHRASYHVACLRLFSLAADYQTEEVIAESSKAATLKSPKCSPSTSRNARLPSLPTTSHVSIPFSTLVTFTSRKWRKNPGTSTGCFQIQAIPGYLT